MKDETLNITTSYCNDNELTTVDEFTNMLKQLAACDIIDNIDDIIERMNKKKRQIFEKKVLKKHGKPVKAIEIKKHGVLKTYYQTSAKWKASSNIRLASYDAVIDELAAYYKLDENGVVSVNDVFELAIAYKKNNENPQAATISKISADYKRFISNDFMNADITEITAEYLNQYSFELIRRETERGVAMTEKAFKNYKGVLNLIFDYAIKSISGNTPLIRDNPVKHMQNNAYFIKHCKESAKSVNPLQCEPQTDYNENDVIFSEDELREAEDIVRHRMTLKGYTKEDGYYVNGYVFLFAKLTGMRAAEIPALRWTDIKENYIWIHSQQLRANGTSGDHIYCPWTKDDKKHTGNGRRFPLFSSVKNLLDEIKSVQESLSIKSDYIFCHKNGEWIKKEAYETMLRRLFQSLGYNITNNHALRKSFNSNVLIPLGVDVTDRAAMLGHSVETNLRYYSYEKKDNTDALISILDGLEKVNESNENTNDNNLIRFEKRPKSPLKSTI